MPSDLLDIFLEASPRLELGVRILQTLALPLGYDAISCIGDADTLCGAGDGVAIFDGDLAERTRAGMRILRSSLREAESRPRYNKKQHFLRNAVFWRHHPDLNWG